MAFDINIREGGLNVVSNGNPLNSERTSQDRICVNSCGYNYFDHDKKRVTITRPSGRLDYQLIYIQKGKADFILNGSSTLLEQGSLILYKPGEPQHYSYYTSCPTVAYWVHFTGVFIETLLRQNNIWDQSAYQLGEEPAIAEIIMKLVRELQFRSYNYQMMCNAYFEELICVISRNLHKQHVPAMTQYEAFIPVLEQMYSEYHVSHSIDEYASLCGMSAYYFIRKFKEYTGQSPHTFLIRLRMERAKNLLLSTNMSVSDISFAVGYDNPLYFSRLFKKYTGSSPSDFKKQY